VTGGANWTAIQTIAQTATCTQVEGWALDCWREASHTVRNRIRFRPCRTLCPPDPCLHDMPSVGRGPSARRASPLGPPDPAATAFPRRSRLRPDRGLGLRRCRSTHCCRCRGRIDGRAVEAQLENECQVTAERRASVPCDHEMLSICHRCVELLIAPLGPVKKAPQRTPSGNHSGTTTSGKTLEDAGGASTFCERVRR